MYLANLGFSTTRKEKTNTNQDACYFQKQKEESIVNTSTEHCRNLHNFWNDLIGVMEMKVTTDTQIEKLEFE